MSNSSLQTANGQVAKPAAANGVSGNGTACPAAEADGSELSRALTAPTADRARLQAVLHCVGDGVLYDMNGVLEVNPAGLRLLGLDSADDLHHIRDSVRHIDGRPLAPGEGARERALAAGGAVHFRLRAARGNGVERIFEGTSAPIVGPDGTQLGVVTSFRDVTDEHERTELTERFLEQLVETLPLAVRVADAETGEVVSVNRAMTELVGYTADEMVGTTPAYPWWAAGTDNWDLLPGNGPVEKLFRRRDGRLVPVEVVPFQLNHADGRPMARVALVSDLSERRRFEQQVVQSGKLAAIGELAAGVAHEINNPLFAILGLVEFLLRDAEPGTKQHDRLELIQQTGLEIKDVVKALLDFARERSDEFELVSLEDVLRQAADLVRRTSLFKGIELEEHYPAKPLIVHASSGQVKQVLLNLITNAQQAMGATGRITVGLSRDGADVLVTVTNTGPRIPDDVLARVFDPFFTTKRDLGGTGLGLALSQSIAEAHHGTLTAGPGPGDTGAEFVLRIPLAEEPA